jgi:prepilin-type N-terminal cleavage/methylation domain-containing protein
MTRRGQRGFTLIELMVALLVSSLLVGMILAIFSRMSLAYRGQQQIAGVQQVLAAARATIELDAKQAGLGMSQGFKSVPTGAVLQSPVKVVDAANAPDQVAFFYADTSTQGVVTAGALPTLTLDSVTGFSPGQLVVLSTSSTMVSPGHAADPYVASYQACIVKIAAAGIAGLNVTFDPLAPWGPSTAAGCTVSSGATMMYPLVAHAYRIDTAATTRGALQMSTNGGLLGVNDTWNDLAYGFSDIQTAVRLEDNGVNGDIDADGDAVRNWYSGANQVTATSLPITPANALVIGMSISLVAHTDRDVEGIATLSTPALTGAIVNNNNLGNRPSTVLPTARPWPDPLLPGLAVYRYTTFTVDFRNLGVGQ